MTVRPFLLLLKSVHQFRLRLLKTFSFFLLKLVKLTTKSDALEIVLYKLAYTHTYLFTEYR